MFKEVVNTLLLNIGVWIFGDFLNTLKQTQEHLPTQVTVLPRVSQPLEKKKFTFAIFQPIQLLTDKILPEFHSYLKFCGASPNKLQISLICFSAGMTHLSFVRSSSIKRSIHWIFCVSRSLKNSSLQSKSSILQNYHNSLSLFPRQNIQSQTNTGSPEFWSIKA